MRAAFLAGAMAACVVAAAQESLPTVDEVLAKYVAAAGGKAALEKVTSRVSKGKFDVPQFGAGGPFEQYAKAPDKIATVIQVEGYGTVNQAYDGQGAWAQDPERGLRDLTGDEADRMKRGADFHRALHFKDSYSKVTVKGKDKVGGHDAWVLECVPATGATDKAYFDTESGLLVRVDFGSASMYFEDYKAVDGVKLAHTIRQESAEIAWVVKIAEVQHNTPIDDAKFKKPQ